jgi:hypothetical protein
MEFEVNGSEYLLNIYQHKFYALLARCAKNERVNWKGLADPPFTFLTPDNPHQNSTKFLIGFWTIHFWSNVVLARIYLQFFSRVVLPLNNEMPTVYDKT